MSIQFVNGDPNGRAIPSGNPFDSDGPMVALINSGHDDADRDNQHLREKWLNTVVNWQAEILRTGKVSAAPVPPPSWIFHNDLGDRIHGGKEVQDGQPIADPPTVPATGISTLLPAPLGSGTDTRLDQLLAGMKAMWDVLQAIKTKTDKIPG